MQLHVNRGETVNLSQLPTRSIALDGYVQGPALDLDNQRYSFDHHDGVIRLITSATCRQVQDALLLGLNPSGFNVYINDVDGDTVLSVWLLQHASIAVEPLVRRLVEVVACIDAHGAAYPPSDPNLASLFYDAVMLPEITVRRNRTYGTCDLRDLLQQCLTQLDRLIAGELAPTVKNTTPPSYEITHRGSNGWVMAKSDAFIFGELYKAGIVAAVSYQELPGGSFLYTVARKSDLVSSFPVGPHTTPGTILYALAAAEPGWGGGTSIGGAPRNIDGSRSHLTPQQVIEIVDAVLTSR